MLGLGDEIFPSRQHLAHGADLGGDVLDAVDDFAIFITEDDIAVLAHDFHNQLLVAEVAEVVEVLNLKMDDALHMGLENACDFPVGNVLAQQHAEIRGSHGAGLVLVCQVNQGEGGAGREYEAYLAFCALDGQQELVLFRLGDFADPAVLYGVVEFFY